MDPFNNGEVDEVDEVKECKNGKGGLDVTSLITYKNTFMVNLQPVKLSLVQG